MKVFVVFILWFLLAEALLTAARLFLRKKPVGTGLRVLLITGKALLAVVFGVLVLAGPVQLRPVQPFMTALYAALLADAFADLCYTDFCSLKKRERRFGGATVVSLVCGVLFLVYGMVNMETVTPKYHTYQSEKLQTEHTIVFVADLHVGGAQPMSVTKKVVDAIGALQPEAVILGGDIVDDYTTEGDMTATFRWFGDLDAPVYYAYGNHDRQGHAQYAGGRKFTPEKLEEVMRSCGVTILKDEFVQLAPDLVLLGREDVSEGESRKDVSGLVNPWPEACLIVADHQPAQAKENAKLGMDLQLSGHTHAGQLFPLKLLYNLIGYVYGDYTVDGATMLVSAGACGWRMPFRTDARCEYDVITLQPQP